MAEPLMPRPDEPEDAADVGSPDEPDVLPGEGCETAADPGLDRETAFRTPVAGERLTAEQLDGDAAEE